MVKKWKVYLIALITLVMCITTFFGLSTLNAYAFSRTNSSLTEQELYNATNTYNVDNSGFIDGEYQPNSDEDNAKKTNNLIYNIRYNMSQKNSNQVMNDTQKKMKWRLRGKTRQVFLTVRVLLYKILVVICNFIKTIQIKT